MGSAICWWLADGRDEEGGVMCRSAPVLNWGTTNVGGQKPAINNPPSNIGKSFTSIQQKKRLDRVETSNILDLK